MADDNAATASAGDTDENGLGFGGDRDLGERSSDPSTTTPASSAIETERREYQRRRSFDAGDLPEGMEARYLAERRRLTGEQRYYETASDTKPAFRDKGDRLLAENNSRDLIRDMLEIAEHRGWDRVRVSGTEEFRREVWREAALRGIEVDGYRPKDREVQEVTRARDKKDARANFISSGDERSPPPSHKDRITDDEGGSAVPPRSPKRADFNEGVAGRLVDVGEAHYRGKPTGKITPFADIILDDGRQERAWGVGLPDALRASSIAIDDQVTLRRLGTERVQVTVAVLDPESGARSSEVREVNRNRWSAERLLTPTKETSPKAALSKSRSGREAGIDIVRAAAPYNTDRPTRVRIRTETSDSVERAFNPGDEQLGIRTAPRQETTIRDAASSSISNHSDRKLEQATQQRVPDQMRRDGDPIVPSKPDSDIDPQNRRSGLERDTISRLNPRDHAAPTEKEPARERRIVGEVVNTGEHDRNLELADRFRGATSAEAARDPELQAAQSQFVAAKAIVTSTLGHEPIAAQRLIAQSRETIARAIEHGKPVPPAELRPAKVIQSHRERPAPERNRLEPSSSGTPAVTKAPTRSRTR